MCSGNCTTYHLDLIRCISFCKVHRHVGVNVTCCNDKRNCYVLQSSSLLPSSSSTPPPPSCCDAVCPHRQFRLLLLLLFPSSPSPSPSPFPILLHPLLLLHPEAMVCVPSQASQEPRALSREQAPAAALSHWLCMRTCGAPFLPVLIA